MVIATTTKSYYNLEKDLIINFFNALLGTMQF